MARIKMVCSEPNPIRWIGFLEVSERKEGCCMAAAKGRGGILMVYNGSAGGQFWYCQGASEKGHSLDYYISSFQVFCSWLRCRRLVLFKFAVPKARIAQLVEHNLAKVGVASSSLVSRSKLKGFPHGKPFFLRPSWSKWRLSSGAENVRSDRVGST